MTRVHIETAAVKDRATRLRSRRSVWTLAFLSVVFVSSGDAFVLPTTRTIGSPYRSSSSFRSERTQVSAFLLSKIGVGDWLEKVVQKASCLTESFFSWSSSSLANSHWYQNPIVVMIGIALGIFVTGIGQGAAAVLNFRTHFADAPLPKVPCHGVVLNRQTVTTQKPSDKDNPPLRLLVIGDSLAVGVGQMVACTPVLPEIIASVMSSTLKRPVFWTCFGETGASTPFILKMMNRPDSSQAIPDFHAVMQKCGTVTTEKDDEDLGDFIAQGTYTNKTSSPLQRTEDDLLQYWRERLYKYRQSFDRLYLDANAWEPFDVIILLTGANDLKSFFFPFLLAKEERDSELRDQADAQSENGFVADMELFIHTITEKMERGWNKTIENIQASAAEVSEALQFDGFDEGIKTFLYEMDPFDGSRNNTLTGSSLSNGGEVSTNSTSGDRRSPEMLQSNTTSGLSPLFVLPAMPIRSVPGFAKAPLSWLARPIFDGLNKKKQAYAQREGHTIFVDEQRPVQASDQNAQDLIWDESRDESILLSVQSILPDECRSIRGKMKDFYDSKRDVATSQGRVSAFVSPDTIHPTESGYNAWGRHIGEAIAKELKSTPLTTRATADRQVLSDAP